MFQRLILTLGCNTKIKIKVYAKMLINRISFIVVCTLILGIYSISTAQDTTNTIFQDNKEYNGKLENLKREIESLKISKDYFSSVLSTQTTIFTAITALFFGLTWVFSYLGMRQNIKKEMANYKIELDKWKLTTLTQFNNKVKNQIEPMIKELNLLNGEINKIYSEKYKEEKEYGLTLLFSLRAASYFLESNSIDRILLCLKMSNDASNKLTERTDLLTFTDEIWQLTSLFSDVQYNLYIAPLNKNLKKLYEDN